MPIRYYQREFLEAIAARKKDGVSLQLGVIPTGTGKSVVIAGIPQYVKLNPGEQMLVLAHREELLDQNAAKLQKYNPELQVEIEQAGRRATNSANVIVASVPSIGKLKKPKKDTAKQQSLLDSNEPPDFCDRLRKFDPDRVRIVVTDEAHHSIADSYRTVYRYFRVAKGEPRFFDPEKLHIGTTATPNRADNAGLEGNYDEIVYTKTLLEMIREKWLVEPISFRANTQIDIGSVGRQAGDFAKKDLEAKINTEERNQIIVDNYKALGCGEPGIAFTVDVAHTEGLAAQFLKNNIKAIGISGATKGRAEILQAYSRREVSVLVSCGVLGEGVDLPNCVVGLMARPTLSGLLFEQQFGRMLRPCPAPEDYQESLKRGMPPRYVKRHAIIIDFVDMSRRHRLNTVATLFGLPQQFDLKGAIVSKEIEKLDSLLKKARGTAQLDMFENTRSLESFVEQIDMFAVPVTPPEIKRFSRFSWVASGTGYYELLLPDEEYSSLRLSMNALGEFELRRCVKGFMTLLGRRPSLEDGLKWGDSLVSPESMTVLRTDASWRTDPPTDKQIKRLSELMPSLRKPYGTFQEFSRAMASIYNKGSISAMITRELAKRGAR